MPAKASAANSATARACGISATCTGNPKIPAAAPSIRPARTIAYRIGNTASAMTPPTGPTGEITTRSNVPANSSIRTNWAVLTAAVRIARLTIPTTT